MPVSVQAIERDLVARLRLAGRGDIADRAVDGVRLTDDGGTIYVHIFARSEWLHYRAGDAYPLAFADHPQLCSLAQWREFLAEAKLLLADDFPRIVRWFDGR